MPSTVKVVRLIAHVLQKCAINQIHLQTSWAHVEKPLHDISTTSVEITSGTMPMTHPSLDMWLFFFFTWHKYVPLFH